MPYMIIHFFQNLAVSQNFFLKNSQKHASKASCVILNIFFSTHQDFLPVLFFRFQSRNAPVRKDLLKENLLQKAAVLLHKANRADSH